jgi:hypothetical protein
MTGELKALWQSPGRRTVLQGAGLLGGCVVVAVTAVLWAVTARGNAQDENLQEQIVVAGDAQLVGAGTDVVANLPRLVTDTKQLQQSGFAAAADRVAWIDATVHTLDQLRPIAYAVEARVAQTQPAVDSLQQRYQQAGLDPPELERNDLLLSVQGLTEDELAAAIEQIGARASGIVRVEHCKLDRRADGVGVDADCTLARYRLRQAVEVPAS